MKLSAPVHVLKSKAKELKRSRSIPLYEALNEVARSEGYTSWSLLQSKHNSRMPATAAGILDNLFPGNLLLIGARPGLGKTMLALELLLLASREGRPSFFFSLEYTCQETEDRLRQIDTTFDPDGQQIKMDFSDDVSAEHVIKQTRGSVKEGSPIVIDYLQLLDQRRDKPPLQKQIEDLKAFTRETKCILVFISQIDRAFEGKGQTRPSLADVRLPNPLDLNLFNKSVFVNDDAVL